MDLCFDPAQTFSQSYAILNLSISQDNSKY